MMSGTICVQCGAHHKASTTFQLEKLWSQIVHCSDDTLSQCNVSQCNAMYLECYSKDASEFKLNLWWHSPKTSFCGSTLLMIIIILSIIILFNQDHHHHHHHHHHHKQKARLNRNPYRTCIEHICAWKVDKKAQITVKKTQLLLGFRFDSRLLWHEEHTTEIYEAQHTSRSDVWRMYLSAASPPPVRWHAQRMDPFNFLATSTSPSTLPSSSQPWSWWPSSEEDNGWQWLSDGGRPGAF